MARFTPEALMHLSSTALEQMLADRSCGWAYDVHQEFINRFQIRDERERKRAMVNEIIKHEVLDLPTSSAATSTTAPR